MQWSVCCEHFLKIDDMKLFECEKLKKKLWNFLLKDLQASVKVILNFAKFPLMHAKRNQMKWK